jgi:hypothetical protein
MSIEYNSSPGSEDKLATVTKKIEEYCDVIDNVPFSSLAEISPVNLMIEYSRTMAEKGMNNLDKTKASMLFLELMIKYVEKALTHLENLHKDPLHRYLASSEQEEEKEILSTTKMLIQRLKAVKYDTLEYRERLSLIEVSRETHLFYHISTNLNESEEIINDTIKRKVLRKPLADVILSSIKKNIARAEEFGHNMEFEEKKLERLTKKINKYLAEQEIYENGMPSSEAYTEKESVKSPTAPTESYTRELKPKTEGNPDDIVVDFNTYLKKVAG